MSEKEKFTYVSYITSAINAFSCLAFMVKANFSCDPPAELRMDGFLGNTYMKNQYCVDNPSYWDIICIAQFGGYLFFDLMIVVFFI